MNKKYIIMFNVSLILITLVSVIWVANNAFKLNLSDNINRIMGIIDLASIFFLIFSAVKIKTNKKGE